MAADEVRGAVLIALVPHMDAGDRDRWAGDQDERPLSALGRAQSLAFANALSGEAVVALYASPAARARETLGPFAERTGLPIQVLDSLAEQQMGEDIEAMTDRAVRALGEIAKEWAGMVVAASHGDVIPAVVKRLAQDYGLSPEPLVRRGQWYAIRFEGEAVSIELRASA